MILITGSTGNLGSCVIKNLLKHTPAENIIALARDAGKASELLSLGVEVRQGDYSDTFSLKNSFEGVEKLLLVSSAGENALQEHKNVIEMAKKSGVKHLFYTSGALNREIKDNHLGPLNGSYFETEDLIRDSGLKYTIFQNGLYSETIPFFIGEDPVANGIYLPAGNGKASFAKRTEMGEAIANIIAGDGHHGKTYMLTEDTSYSFQEIAGMLSEISGTDVKYSSPSMKDYESWLRDYGASEGDIYFSSLLAECISHGEFDAADHSLEKILGRKPTGMRDFLKETYYP